MCRALLTIYPADWELEISKRFAQPLFSESNEFPDAEILHKRMVPICYQEGLTGGCGTACSDLMTVAAETFVKEQLSDIFRRVRSNAPNYIKTAKFRRKLEKEEEAYSRGEIQKNSYGLLPIEVDVETRRKPFNREDLRLAALMGNSFLAQSRILNEKVVNAPFVEEEYDEDEEMSDVGRAGGAVTNGFHRNGFGKEEGMEDAVEWGWSGGFAVERGQLDRELDDVLAGL
jgi:transcriptional coactivator HFI1/ADA1